RNDGRNFGGGRDFNRGAGINGRGPEQVGFRNGYSPNGSRMNYAGADRGNGAQFRSGYTGQQGRGFSGGNGYRGGYSGQQAVNGQSYRSGYSAPQGSMGQSYRGGYNAYSAPQGRTYGGGNYGMQARGNYSAPASQMRTYGGGSFGGARPN